MPDAPSDPIAAALRVAALGVCSPSGRVPCETPCSSCRSEAAAAIAAFLRALPRYMVEPSSDGGIVAMNAHNIAAVVERAAAGREGET